MTDATIDTAPGGDSYEEALLRGRLLPAERDAVIASIGSGKGIDDVSLELGLPRELVFRVVGDPATADEIVALVRTAQRVEFVVSTTRMLLDVVRSAAPLKERVEAAKLLNDILGKEPKRGPGRPPKDISRGALSLFEAAVRGAADGVPS